MLLGSSDRSSSEGTLWVRVRPGLRRCFSQLQNKNYCYSIGWHFPQWEDTGTTVRNKEPVYCVMFRLGTMVVDMRARATRSR